MFFPSLTALYYLWYGVLLAIYFYILLFSKKEKKTVKEGPNGSNNNSSTNTFAKKVYLNIYFLDHKETIRNIIRSKVPRNRPVIRALAKRAAVALLEKGFVEKVASNLCKVIPDRLEMMGIKVAVNLAYSQKAYACVELALLGIDFDKFLTFNAGKDKATAIMGFLDKYSLPAINQFLERSLIEFMAGKLTISLPASMREKLYLKMNADVEIIACTEEEQGPYLVQTIAQLDSDSSSSSSSSSAAPTIATPATKEKEKEVTVTATPVTPTSHHHHHSQSPHHHTTKEVPVVKAEPVDDLKN